MQFYPLATWEKLRADYVNGAGCVRRLAEKYQVNAKTAEQRAAREGWTRLRRERGQAQLASLVPTVAPPSNTTTASAPEKIGKSGAPKDHREEGVLRTVLINGMPVQGVWKA